VKILILGQGEKGGTDSVLEAASKWLIDKGHNVCYSNQNSEIRSINYDLGILPTSQIHIIPSLCSKDANPSVKTFLVWAMGSRAFHGVFYNQMKVNCYKKFLNWPLDILVKTTLTSLLKDRSIIFTDEVGMNSDILTRNNLDHSNLIYPIPIKSYSQNPRQAFPIKPRSFMWIGRIDSDFKILPLLKVINDISHSIEDNLLPDYPKFTIVGTGDAMGQLRAQISSCTRIDFILIDWLDKDSLCSLLINQADILFAMGSSALLGASLGVPTVIVQPYSSTENESQTIYRWIHETNGHSLGEFPMFECKPMQIKRRFSELFSDISLQEHSNLSKEYSQRFNEDLVFERLMQRDLPMPSSQKTILLLKILYLIKSIKRKLKNVLCIHG
jgi:hypothetical protein